MASITSKDQISTSIFQRSYLKFKLEAENRMMLRTSEVHFEYPNDFLNKKNESLLFSATTRTSPPIRANGKSLSMITRLK